jgi:hypothetical protein
MKVKFLAPLILLMFVFFSCEKNEEFIEENYSENLNLTFRELSSRTFNSLEEESFFKINYVDRTLDIKLNSQVRTSKVF